MRWVVGIRLTTLFPSCAAMERPSPGTPYRQLSNSQPGGRAQRCCPVRQSQRSPAEATKLWFVNLGAYRSIPWRTASLRPGGGPLQHRPKPQRGGDGFRVWSRSTKTICMAWIRIRPSMICCPSAAMVSGTSDLNRQKLVRIQTTDRLVWVSIDLIKAASPRHIQSHSRAVESPSAAHPFIRLRQLDQPMGHRWTPQQQAVDWR